MEILNQHVIEEPAIVRWKFDADSKHADKIIFEQEEALAVLLLEGVVFLNSHWWEKEWPEDAKNKTSINVNCGDTFAYACSDAEGMDFSELEDLYDHWAKDPDLGPTIWCCKKRNEMPLKPIVDWIKESGIWDIDSMGLEPNYYENAE